MHRPRNKNKIGENIKELITPSALPILANDGKNSFYVKSYECIMKNTEIFQLGERCGDCTNFWRNKFRNEAPGQTLPIKPL